jgi:protein-S-isoprenylcysteine O-methyltransferase Ste14
MTARDFEFRHRLWLFWGIYLAAFLCYGFDHTCAGEALVRLLVGPQRNPAQGRYTLHAVYGAGGVLVVAGAMLRTWAAAFLQSQVLHDLDLRSETLVADGPYRWVRNPLYLGGVIVAAGVGLIASRTGWFVLVAGMIVFAYRLIGREEMGLLASQGETYRAYCAAVPRLFPSLLPRVARAGLKPLWNQAVVGESWVWVLAAAVVCYALTLKIEATYGIVVAALLSFVLRQTHRRQRAK